MKRKPAPLRIEHRPLPRDYAPRYPVALAPSEYRELVARRNHERVRALLAAGIACLVVERAVAQEPVPKRAPVATLRERETQVVRALQVVAEDRELWGLDKLRHAARTSETTRGSARHQVHVPLTFGSAPFYFLERGATTRLAAELFRAYGLEPELGVRLDEEPVHTVLEGADRARKVAFKLMGRARSTEPYETVMEPEPPADDLSTEESDALAKQGWKLQMIEMAEYGSEQLRDLEPYLAYAFGIVDFLNSIDDGPDVDLLGLHFTRHLALDCPLGAAFAWKGDAPKLEPDEGTQTTRLVVARPTSFTLSFPVEATRARRTTTRPDRTDPFPETAPVTGAITCLQLPITRVFEHPDSAAPRQRMKARLVQEGLPGALPFVVEANASVLFLGSDFDPLRAFTIELELDPGRYVYTRELFVSVPRR
ncbi:MAG: hypothetical protein IPJ77_02295 [Planctomycetes bacterium]|nr:hypothetical protein [Planctomycetota bacterium]